MGCLMDPFDLDHHQQIAARSRRRSTFAGRIVGAWGNLGAMLSEHPAERQGPETVPIFINEHDHHGSRGPRSRASILEAANSISLARLSSRTSAFNSLTSTPSLVVAPGRRPASMSP